MDINDKSLFKTNSQKILFIGVILGLFTGLVSCRYQHAGPNDVAQSVDSQSSASNLPLSANFESLYQNVFSKRCISCHGGANPDANLRLERYEDYVERHPVHGWVVFKGNPGSSSLFKQIISGKMPKNSPKLSDAEIEVIKEWIELGAPNRGNDDDDKPEETEENEDGHEDEHEHGESEKECEEKKDSEEDGFWDEEDDENSDYHQEDAQEKNPDHHESEEKLPPCEEKVNDDFWEDDDDEKEHTHNH